MATLILWRTWLCQPRSCCADRSQVLRSTEYLGQQHLPLEPGCPPTALIKKDTVGRRPTPGSQAAGASPIYNVAFHLLSNPSRRALLRRAGSASPRAGGGARPRRCDMRRDMAGLSAGGGTQHRLRRTQKERQGWLGPSTKRRFRSRERQGRQALVEAVDSDKTAWMAPTKARRKVRNEGHRGWTRLQTGQERQALAEAVDLDLDKTAGMAPTKARRKVRNEAHRGWTRLQVRI